MVIITDDIKHDADITAKLLPFVSSAEAISGNVCGNRYAAVPLL